MNTDALSPFEFIEIIRMEFGESHPRVPLEFNSVLDRDLELDSLERLRLIVVIESLSGAELLNSESLHGCTIAEVYDIYVELHGRQRGVIPPSLYDES